MNFWSNASPGMKILVVAVIVAALIGVFYLLSGGFGAQPEPTPTPVASVPTTAPTATDTPVPTPEPSEPPVAVISGPTQTLVGEAITLSAADSRAAEGSEIVSYQWDLGDGVQSTNMEVTHTYQEAGEYEVSLTVVDNNGLENRSTIKLTVEEPTPTPTSTFEPTATPEPQPTNTPEPTATPVDPSDALERREWKLLNTLPDTEITILFVRGKATGFAGCNEFRANYQTASDGSIRITDIQAGRQVCEQPIMEQEQTFLDALAEVVSFEVLGSQGKQLTLTAPTGLLQFETEE
ncbi:MAG: META domain-containing protein [Chloroflexi bacterium]|nr:META domain-containing protein [Chloroflexota bacterium]